jgi:pectate lyase
MSKILAFTVSCLCLSLGCGSGSGGGGGHNDAASSAGTGGAGGETSPPGSGGATGGANGTGGVLGTGGTPSGGGTLDAAFPGTGGITRDAGSPDAGSGTGGTTKVTSDGSAGGESTGGHSGGGVGGVGIDGSAGNGAGGAGHGGSSGSGGSGTGNCTTPPQASILVGWASVSDSGVSTTTGGGDAAPTTVTSLSELQAAAKGTTAAVIYVKGVMAAGAVTVGSNKTIVGLCGAEIHGHMEVGGSVNVIVRNIKIVGHAVGNCALDPSYDSSVGCSSGQDAISVQKNAHHIWFDHCDISDGTDGNLDISNGANYVTVSWTKFHYTPRTDNSGSDSTGASGHRYSNLVGGTDKPSTYDDANSLNVTWHHNWWADNVVERQPRVRFGKNHIVNNLYTSSGDNYCVRAGKQAQLLIENNVFSGVKSPHEFNSSTDQGTAYITSTGNDYQSCSGSQDTGGSGTPFSKAPYSYTADATSGLQTAIQSGAGPH